MIPTIVVKAMIPITVVRESTLAEIPITVVGAPTMTRQKESGTLIAIVPSLPLYPTKFSGRPTAAAAEASGDLAPG